MPHLAPEGIASKFWRNVTTVLGSTAIAQLFPIAVLPFFTRNVGPSGMGVYFLWLGASGVLIVLATAKLDMAIFTAETEQAVNDLLRLIILSSCCIAFLTIVVVKLICPLFPNIAVDYWTIMEFSGALAILSMFMAINQSLFALLIYRADFKRFGWAKMFTGGLISLLQVLAVLVGGGLGALIYAHLLATILATALIMRWAKIFPTQLISEFSKHRTKEIILKNFRFPVYSMPADFINTFSAQLPVFLIMARFGSASVAFYALTLRILAGPIGLFANSVLTVFKEQAGRDFRERGNCVAAYRFAFKSLFLLAIFPFVLLGGFGEKLFVFVFGAEWAVAGHYAQMLSPMFFLKFISSPLSYTLYIAHRQLHDLVWQVFLLAMTWASFSLTSDLASAVATYSLGYSCMYIVYIIMSFQAACGDKK
jgi:O-antigen/teichoic acid export membrane protein